MTPPTPEEMAAVLAALAARRSVDSAPTPYEIWRRTRREALRRRS